MKTWKEDHEQLRQWIKELPKKRVRGIPSEPFEVKYSTMLYVLISHMRGKLHMRSCLSRSGGWSGKTKLKNPAVQLPRKILKAYHDPAMYYARSAIEDREDQAEFIRTRIVEDVGSNALRELAERVVTNIYSSYETTPAMAGHMSTVG